jgi:hypothetical protein
MKIPTRDEQNRWLDAYVKPLMQFDVTIFRDNVQRRSEGLLTRTELVDELREIKDDLFYSADDYDYEDKVRGEDARDAVQRLRGVIEQAETYLSSSDEETRIGELMSCIISGMEHVQRGYNGYRSLVPTDDSWKLPDDGLNFFSTYEMNDRGLYAHLTDKLQTLDKIESGEVTEEQVVTVSKIARLTQIAETAEDEKEGFMAGCQALGLLIRLLPPPETQDPFCAGFDGQLGATDVYIPRDLGEGIFTMYHPVKGDN